MVMLLAGFEHSTPGLHQAQTTVSKSVPVKFATPDARDKQQALDVACLPCDVLPVCTAQEWHCQRVHRRSLLPCR